MMAARQSDPRVMPPAAPGVDLFCRVIDNYGDIGVCWRLARCLHQDHGCPVRLWVDDLRAFQHLCRAIDPGLSAQAHAGIEIIHWSGSIPDLEPHDIVIEAFACDPPTSHIARMPGRSKLWLNLEYLATEAWAAGCHGMESPQPDGQRKFFFFPGFLPGTGGILREKTLTRQRQEWQADTAQVRRWLTDLLPHDETARALLEQPDLQIVTLFCYPDAPVAELLLALGRLPGQILLLVPERVMLPALPATLAPNLHIARIPFLPQPEYDRLLWSADLNLVRGEDSFVRALLAGQPMLWQAYRQDEEAHLAKVEGWLHQTQAPETIRQAWLAWNRPADAGTAEALEQGLRCANRARWHTFFQDFSAYLDGQHDLASALLAFYYKQTALSG